MSRNLIATAEVDGVFRGGHMAKGTVVDLEEKTQFCFVGIQVQEKAVVDNSGKIRWTILRRMLNAKLPLLLIKRLTFYYSPHYVLKIGPAAV